MFQISDVMIDKDEVAMSLNIHIQLDEETEDGSVSENSSGVSKSHTEIILQKAVEIEEGDTPETLQRRVMEQAEWKLLPRATELVCRAITEEEN